MSFGLTAVFTGCNSRSERGPIPHDQFVQIYADMMFLSELHRNDAPGYRAALDSLYRTRNVDSLQVSTTMSWYASRHKELVKLYEDVTVRLETRSRKK